MDVHAQKVLQSKTTPIDLSFYGNQYDTGFGLKTTKINFFTYACYKEIDGKCGARKTLNETKTAINTNNFLQKRVFTCRLLKFRLAVMTINVALMVASGVLRHQYISIIITNVC